MRLSVLILTSLFLACSLQASSTQSVPRDAIYESCGHDLFDQHKVTESDAYAKADMEQKRQLLLTHFLNKRRLCYGIEFGKVLAMLAPAFGLVHVIYRRNEGGAAVAAAGLTSALLTYSIVGRTLEAVGNFAFMRLDVARNLVENIIWPSSNDLLFKYEQQYVQQKPWMSQAAQEAMEENFIQARALNPKDSYDYGQGSSKKKSPVEFASAMLSLPSQKIEIDFDEERMNSALGTYAPEVFHKLEKVAMRHAAASTGKTVKKIVVYFHGAPGVGKTRAAEALAEQVLRVPYRVINLAGKTVADLEGDANKPGLFLEALLQAKLEGRGAKNAIFVFEEIDRVVERDNGRDAYGARQPLLPKLLTLLDPFQKTFYSPYLGIEIDISDLAFILNGNGDVTDDALRNRLEIVHFQGYSGEFKVQVVEEKLFDQLLQTYSSAKHALTRSDFSEEDWKQMREAIVQEQDPGFRKVIEYLQNFIDEKAVQKYVDAARAGRNKR